MECNVYFGRKRRRQNPILTSLWLILLMNAAPHVWATHELDSLRALAETAENDTLKAQKYNRLGAAFIPYSLDSALNNFKVCLHFAEIAAESRDPKTSREGNLLAMDACNNIGVVLNNRGLYPQALQYYQRCLVISKQFKNKSGTYRALNNIGVIKISQENYEEAQQYFEKALEMAKEMHDTILNVAAISNIGDVLKLQKRFDEALVNYTKCLALARASHNGEYIVDEMLSIGSIQLETNQLDSALMNFEASLVLADSLEYVVCIPKILNSLTEAHRNLGNLPMALQFAQAAVDSSRKVDLPEETIDALEMLADIHAKMGHYAQAYATLVAYNQLEDSIFTLEKADEFSQMEQSFDYDRKQYEATILAQEQADQVRAENLRQYTIAFACLMGIVVLMLIGMRYARAQKLRYIVVFMSLLFFFEFLLVLIDSTVERLTGGLPMPKLAVNIALAAFIAPLNSVLERWLVKRDGNNGQIE